LGRRVEGVEYRLWSLSCFSDDERERHVGGSGTGFFLSFIECSIPQTEQDENLKGVDMVIKNTSCEMALEA